MTNGEWAYVAAVGVFGLVGAAYGTVAAVAVGVIGIAGFLHHVTKKENEQLLQQLKKEAVRGFNVRLELPRLGAVTACFQLDVKMDGTGVPTLKSVVKESSSEDLLADLTESELQSVMAICQQEADDGARLMTKLRKQT
jgi:hypothetical protein